MCRITSWPNNSYGYMLLNKRVFNSVYFTNKTTTRLCQERYQECSITVRFNNLFVFCRHCYIITVLDRTSPIIRYCFKLLQR